MAQTEALTVQADQHAPTINVGRHERDISLIGGTVLAIAAFKTSSFLGFLTVAGIAGGLIYRGISGHCPINSMMERDTSKED